ncbi:golgin subfamily A member 6-like protein 4 [Mya arenaria]|uniref:golgin subfamily A member 6-like protein 4 n=1 Tax=Mya arenaria TaxID=6604 RepID=UPI0022E2E49D|nr:golgin subfamily A member 6-like protein 4 [Mya arenaria]
MLNLPARLCNAVIWIGIFVSANGQEPISRLTRWQYLERQKLRSRLEKGSRLLEKLNVQPEYTTPSPSSPSQNMFPTGLPVGPSWLEQYQLLKHILESHLNSTAAPTNTEKMTSIRQRLLANRHKQQEQKLQEQKLQEQKLEEQRQKELRLQEQKLREQKLLEQKLEEQRLHEQRMEELRLQEQRLQKLQQQEEKLQEKRLQELRLQVQGASQNLRQIAKAQMNQGQNLSGIDTGGSIFGPSDGGGGVEIGLRPVEDSQWQDTFGAGIPITDFKEVNISTTVDPGSQTGQVDRSSTNVSQPPNSNIGQNVNRQSAALPTLNGGWMPIAEVTRASSSINSNVKNKNTKTQLGNLLGNLSSKLRNRALH